MGMRAVPIERSSVIDHIAYDEVSTTLRISFRDTGDYIYFDVPAELFDRFRGASSADAAWARDARGTARSAHSRGAGATIVSARARGAA